MVCSFIQILGVKSHSKMCLESKYVQERSVSANHYEAAKLEHFYPVMKTFIPCYVYKYKDVMASQLSDLNPAEHLWAIQEKWCSFLQPISRDPHENQWVT